MFITVDLATLLFRIYPKETNNYILKRGEFYGV